MSIRSILKLTALALILLHAVPANAADPSAGIVHMLSQQPLAGVPGTDVTVFTVEYPPGGSTPPHEHPGTTYAYVLEGAVVSQLNDGPVQTFTKGQMWMEHPHDRHMVSKNASTTEPAKFLVWMIAPHGAQLLTLIK
jgi:quercetin dioxygenase-like cupin family protein